MSSITVTLTTKTLSMLMSAAFEAGLSDTDHGRACKDAFQEALKITTYRLDSDAVQAEANAMAAELVRSRLKEKKQAAGSVRFWHGPGVVCNCGAVDCDKKTDTAD
tara:strand:+ start:2004 stop:2321 length:318 start_codon:yes stop_codon:yes gene_type:complete